MGNCTSKGGAKDVVTTPRKVELKEGAFKYNKDIRKVVYVGDDNRSEATSKAETGVSKSPSVTSEESPPFDNRPDSESKQSLLGEIAEYLEDDVSTQVTEKRGSPSVTGRQNIYRYQSPTTDTRSVVKDRDGSYLDMKSPLLVSPLPLEGEKECIHSKAIHEVNRDTVEIAINNVDMNAPKSNSSPLTIDGQPLGNNKMSESLMKAQALLGEVSERTGREQSQKTKGCEETQSVEIVNVLESDYVDNSNSEHSLTPESPEHDDISEIFSYDTMECEEDLYWKEMRSGNENLSMASFDTRISNADKSHTEETNANSGISNSCQNSSGITIVHHNNIYSHSEDDDDQHYQDLKKDTPYLLSVPTTETEAESFEDMVEESVEGEGSIDTSDWSESMTELIKLCEEDSKAEDSNEGTNSRSDPEQVLPDDHKSPSKSLDNIARLKNIPEHPSPDSNIVSNLTGSSPKITENTASDERTTLSPPIPATLKISHDVLASQNFSPLAAPHISSSLERGPLEMVPKTLTDENSGVVDVTSPYHTNTTMTTKEKTETPLLEQSFTLMAVSEGKSQKLEVPISSTIDVVSNSIMTEPTTPSQLGVITKSATISSSTITESTAANSVVAGTLFSADEIIHSTPLMKEQSSPEDRVITDEAQFIEECAEPLDALEKLKTVEDKLNASHAATMSLSSGSISNSMCEKDESPLMSDTISMSSIVSSQDAETSSSSLDALMPSSLDVATVDSNVSTQQPDSLTVTHPIHDLSNESKLQRTPPKISSPTTRKKMLGSAKRAAVTTKSSSKKEDPNTAKSPLQKKKNTRIVSNADENINVRSSLTSTPKRRSVIPKMTSPGKVKSPVRSPYKNSTRSSSIPSILSPKPLSSTSPRPSPYKKSARNSSIASPRPSSATPIMKSPSPSPNKKVTRNSSIPRVTTQTPSPSPHNKSNRKSSTRGVSPRSITPSTRRNQPRSPYSLSSYTIKSPASESSMQNCKINVTVPLQTSTRDGTPGEMSLDTESATRLSIPFDETQRKIPPARCASPVGSMISAFSASSLLVRDRAKSTQNRFTRYKSSKGCSNRWNPTLYRAKKPCSRCYSLASYKEIQKFEANGHHTVISLTSGGCTKLCTKFVTKDNDEDVVLCRICFNAVHRPSAYLVEESCRSLQY
eukprot:CAMPEP_0198258712 /NCGR_PEP_ID=MMETSP1447-20131203/8050_1 /TAXON_ID=420782 /ORGANISM="Chaetoceros dichaeta, Strain CCMP1751" /LENGTH=1154 /DNA_ID=CAMNT_0043945883 /DNA_START=29 /DNA_END=3496 /DNA_ORIENTATION=-